MYIFRPLQVMPDEIVQGRGGHFNLCAVCESDFHLHLQIVFFLVIDIDAAGVLVGSEMR